MKNTKPQLVLKFGSVKGGNFSGSAKAEREWYRATGIETDEERKAIDLKVIDLYNGEFYEWWGGRVVNKQEAKDYIVNYDKTIS